MLYELVDKIMERWRQVEIRLQGSELKVEGLALSVERHGQHMRLCYNGKPLNECKMMDKIEAVVHLDRLYEEVQKRDSAMLEKAKTALKKLEGWLQEHPHIPT